MSSSGGLRNFQPLGESLRKLVQDIKDGEELLSFERIARFTTDFLEPDPQNGCVDVNLDLLNPAMMMYLDLSQDSSCDRKNASIWEDSIKAQAKRLVARSAFDDLDL
jgi:hypothetical protein